MNSMTAQKVIYNAWKNTPLVTYKNSALNFADPLKHEKYEPEYHGKCNICGKDTAGGIPVKAFLKSSYTDWPIHREPNATHICSSCAFCLGMNPEGRIALFRYPVVAEKMLHICSTAEFRDFLISPPEPPFVMLMPTSRKKHIATKAKVSFSKKYYFCNLEEQVIPVTPKISSEIEKIEALRGIGMTLRDIESGCIGGATFKKFTLNSCEKIVKILQKIRKTETFLLSLAVSQKKEEAESVCYLDLIQKMN